MRLSWSGSWEPVVIHRRGSKTPKSAAASAYNSMRPGQSDRMQVDNDALTIQTRRAGTISRKRFSARQVLRVREFIDDRQIRYHGIGSQSPTSVIRVFR